jgi:hypothetical protein
MIRVYKVRLRKNGTSASLEFVGTRHEADARLRSWMATDPVDHKGDIVPLDIPQDKDGGILHLFNQHATK